MPRGLFGLLLTLEGGSAIVRHHEPGWPSLHDQTLSSGS